MGIKDYKDKCNKRWTDQFRELSCDRQSHSKKVALESDDLSSEESDDESEDSEASKMVKRQRDGPQNLDNNNNPYPSSYLSIGEKLKKVVKRTTLQILDDGKERYIVEYLTNEDDVKRVDTEINQRQQIMKTKEEGKLVLHISTKKESTPSKKVTGISKKDIKLKEK